MAMDEGSEVCVERAFRKVVENPLALHSLMACGCDDVEEEKERAEKDDGKAEKRRSRGTSVFESLCSLSALQDNERTLFFNASLGEAWATKDMEVLFRTDSSYTKLWRAHLHSHGLLRGVLSSFIDFCASDWHSHFDTKVSLKETKSEHARVQRLPRNLTIERRSSLIMAEKTPPSKRRRSQKSIIVKEKMDDMIEIERLAEKERREERERKEVEVVGKHLDLLMEHLLCFVDRFPRSLFEHSTDLSHVLLFKFGDSCERRFFHAIFFLRYVCPALSLPGAFAFAPLSDEVTSHFRVISRVLQNLVADSFFENDQMKQYNPYLESRRDAMDYLMHILCCRSEISSTLEESIRCLRSILSLSRSSNSRSFSSPLSGLPLSPLGSRSQSTSSLLCTSLSVSSHSSPRAALLTPSDSPPVDLTALSCASEAFQEKEKGDECSENVEIQLRDDVSSPFTPRGLTVVRGVGQRRVAEKKVLLRGEDANVLYSASQEMDSELEKGVVFAGKVDLMRLTSNIQPSEKDTLLTEKNPECLAFSEGPIDHAILSSPWPRLNLISSPVWPIASTPSSPHSKPFAQLPFLLSSPSPLPLSQLPHYLSSPGQPLLCLPMPLSSFSSPLPSPSRRMWRVIFDFLQGKEQKMRGKVRECIGLNDFLIQYHAFSSAPSSSSLSPSHPSLSLSPSSSNKAIFEAMTCLKNLSRSLFFYFSNDDEEEECGVSPHLSATSSIPSPSTLPAKGPPTSDHLVRLEEILYNVEYRDAFHMYLKRNFMAEPFEMWQAIEHLSISVNKRRDFIALCEEYVLPNSPSPAPLSHTTIETLRQRYSSLSSISVLCSPTPSSSILTYRADTDYSFLLGVSMELWAVMTSSCLSPFIQSDVWRSISSGVYAEAVEWSREKAEWFFGSKIEGDLCRTEIVTVVRKDYIRRMAHSRKSKPSRPRRQSILSRLHHKSSMSTSPVPKEKRAQQNLATSSSPRAQPKFYKQAPSSSFSSITSVMRSSSTLSSANTSSNALASISPSPVSLSPSPPSPPPSSHPSSLNASSGPVSLSVRRTNSHSVSLLSGNIEMNEKPLSASSSLAVTRNTPTLSVILNSPVSIQNESETGEKEGGSSEEELFRFKRERGCGSGSGSGGKAVGFMCYV